MANEDIKELDENDAIEYINNYLSKKEEDTEGCVKEPEIDLF